MTWIGRSLQYIGRRTLDIYLIHFLFLPNLPRKMPGHMGDVRQTILNLKVMDVRPDVNLLLVKGSIPGANGCYVIVRNAIKKH